MTQRSLRIGAAIAVAAAAIAAYALWQWRLDNGSLEGIAIANGRVEAEEIDVATRIPGRVMEVLVEEGDSVEKGQVLVRIDDAELRASLARAEAEIRRARQAVTQADAQVALRESQCELATKEFERTSKLFDQGHIAAERLDIRRNEKQVAEAACRAARADLGNTQEMVAAAEAEADRLRVQIADTVLTAPRAGRVLYRLTEPGEVLAGGGRAVTLIDLTDVYMTVFLPTREAGRTALGAEARIVLDAVPEITIPARVSYVASRAQFTPRQVETEEERAKLMFRVKVKVAPGLLEKHKAYVKTGLPGVAYIKTGDQAVWPEKLEANLISQE